MINLDRSLPMVIDQPGISLASKYGTVESFLAIRKQMQMLIVQKCIEDPLFFFNYVSAWHEIKNEQENPRS